MGSYKENQAFVTEMKVKLNENDQKPLEIPNSIFNSHSEFFVKFAK